MILLDSNIVIYAIMPEYALLRKRLLNEPFVISILTKIEVLGYHKLSEADREDLERFMDNADVLPIDDVIANKAIDIRKIRKISLADAIIAATAICNNLSLLTRNVTDFQWIPLLNLERFPDFKS